MEATITLGLVCVLLTYLAGRRRSPRGLQASFALIFCFLALRHDFGTDYWIYFDTFSEIGGSKRPTLFEQTGSFEPGWVLLNWVFRSLNFHAMIAAMALGSCAIYYRFIKIQTPIQYQWLAVLMFVFDPQFLLINASAMRQSVAVSLGVLSIDFIQRRNYVMFLLLVGAAWMFHTSAVVLLPVALVGLVGWKWQGKLYLVVCGAIFLLALTYSHLLIPRLQQFVVGINVRYELYQDAGAASTGLGFLFLGAMLAIVLAFDRDHSRRTSIVFKIAVISFLAVPLTLITAMLARVRFYFVPALLAVYPIVAQDIKNPLLRVAFLAALLLFTAYQFYVFFFVEAWTAPFRTYQTFLSGT